MAIKIWYTVNVNPVLNDKVGAEVIRHWEHEYHPSIKGSLPIWAGIFDSWNKAKLQAEREAIYAVAEQQQRDMMCQ